MKGIVISCFDYTTQFVQPWAAAGYVCYCVDIQHPAGETWAGNICRVGADVTTWQPPAGPVAFFAGFPPCTDVASSGARHFKDKGLLRLAEAIRLFGHAVRLAEESGAPYLLENPVSVIATHYRKSDYRFDPCEFAGYLPESEREKEGYTKKTCLWIGGGYIMPAPRPVPAALGSLMHRVGSGPNQANIRSKTPRGFAQAVFQANVQ